MRFSLEFYSDQVHDMVVQVLKGAYEDQEYWIGGPKNSKEAKRIRKHLRGVLEYYMIPDEFKEWEKQNAKD